MRLVTNIFEGGEPGDIYRVMLDVLLRSASANGVKKLTVYEASRNIPDCVRRAHKNPAKPTDVEWLHPVYYNTAKLDTWNEVVQTSTEAIMFIDADTYIRRPVDDVFSLHDFDIAVTRRPNGTLNGGVVFVRPTPASKRFFTRWIANNTRLFENPRELLAIQKVQGGINQPALMQTIERNTEAKIIDLPCAEWNNEDYTWNLFDPDTTRVVHIKGNLRNAIFGGPVHRSLDTFPTIIDDWRRWNPVIDIRKSDNVRTMPIRRSETNNRSTRRTERASKRDAIRQSEGLCGHDGKATPRIEGGTRRAQGQVGGEKLTIAVVLFPDSAGKYRRLLDALELSVNINTTARFEVIEQPTDYKPDGIDTHGPFYWYNSRKLEIWRDMVSAATGPIILLDADMLVLRDPVEAFSEPFDVAITRRPDGLLNGGAVFVRPTRGAREFFEVWYAENMRLYHNPAELSAIQPQQMGMNQPALMNVLESTDAGIAELPCTIWNCCDPCWPDADIDEIGLLHIKGRLREYALANRGRIKLTQDYIRRLGNVWKMYDWIAKTTGVHHR